MKKDKGRGIGIALCMWIAAMALLFLPVCVHAASDPVVRYSRAKKEYHLYRADGKKVCAAGLYKIRGKKAHGHVFDGIYYVSDRGRIDTDPAIHYIERSKKIGGQHYHRGYYHFGKDGKLPSSSGVVYRKGTKVHGYVFRGYYYYTRTGRIASVSNGLVHLSCKVNGRTFDGYYYREAMSRINLKSTIRKIGAKDSCGKRFPGYRYLGKGGRLDTAQTVHRLDLTYENVRYKGVYCFAGKDGRMVRGKGLVAVGDTYYYVKDTKGKCLTNSKKKVQGFTYAFDADGRGRRTSTKLGGLTGQLNSMIGSYGGIWSVYVKKLDDNDSLTINDSPLFAASLIKSFVMASLYEQIQKGNVQETAEIRALLSAMITVSSNEAYNELVMRQTSSHGFLTGCGVVNDYLVRNGYGKTGVHTAYAGLAISDGGTNTTSVKDCGRLLESIYRGTCVDKESSKKMLNLLLAQTRRGKIPAGVPASITVANKTGETSFCDHDMAIVYGPKCTYIICVMSVNSYNSAGRVAQISKAVYDHLNR